MAAAEGGQHTLQSTTIDLKEPFLQFFQYLTGLFQFFISLFLFSTYFMHSTAGIVNLQNSTKAD